MAKSTTDFQEFLDGEDLESYEELEALYLSARDGESNGSFDASTKDDNTFVTGSAGEVTLALIGKKARDAFLRKLNDYKDDPDMDIESYAAFKRNMAKDD